MKNKTQNQSSIIQTLNDEIVGKNIQSYKRIQKIAIRRMKIKKNRGQP